MLIHKDVLAALETIDAAVFSGDTFMTQEVRELFRTYIDSWNIWDKDAIYFSNDGTMMNADGTRSIFDDLDK